MNLLKKITAIIVSTMLLMTSGDISVFAESGEKNISERIIVGEEEIRNYLKANGEEYDPNLIVVYRMINDSDDIREKTMGVTREIVKEYELRERNIKTYTDTNVILDQFNRPAGLVFIDETYTVSEEHTYDVSIPVFELEALLGYKLTSSSSLTIHWENTYDYPVKILIYPVYSEESGQLWEDDVWKDDKCTDFEVHRVVDYVAKFWVDTEAE